MQSVSQNSFALRTLFTSLWIHGS